jgi:hypothetical protein
VSTQFTAHNPSYFNRDAKCDNSFCFRPAHTIFYGQNLDKIVPMFVLCSIHSDTEEDVVLPFERLNERMVQEAIEHLIKTTESFSLDDEIQTLKDLGYEDQVNFETRSTISSLSAKVIVTMSFRAHYGVR